MYDTSACKWWNDIYNGDTSDENIRILVPQVFTFDAYYIVVNAVSISVTNAAHKR